MVITTPKDALRACESLLCNVAEMLTDAEGQARDGDLHEVETQTQGLMQAVNEVIADVRARLAQNGGLS